MNLHLGVLISKLNSSVDIRMSLKVAANCLAPGLKYLAASPLFITRTVLTIVKCMYSKSTYTLIILRTGDPTVIHN